MGQLLVQKFADKLASLNQPVVTNYSLGVILQTLCSQQDPPQIIDKRKLNDEIRLLHDTGILSHFRDYPGVHKLFGKTIDSDEEIVCSINPFAYISHLSAMEYHGLTDRIPRVLIYSVPDQQLPSLERPVDGVLGSLDGEAAVDVDDAPRDGVLLKRWWVGRGRKREEEEVEFISR